MTAATSVPVTVRRAVQRVLAPGGQATLRAQLAARLASAGIGAHARTALDAGCGDASLLHDLGVPFVIGVDLADRRLRTFGGAAVRADVAALPIGDGRVDLAYSCGLLHHLDGPAAARAVAELCRVTAPGGLLLVFDAVRPVRALRAPVAALLRALDRGRHVRTEPQLRALFRAARPGWPWRFERVRYAHTGLEGAWCMARRPLQV